MLKAILVLEIFTFLSRLFVYVGKQVGKKAKINFKTYGVTDWTTCNCNTCIVQYLKKSKQPDNEISSGKSHTKCGGKVSPRSFYKKSKLDISFDQRPEILYKMAQNHTQNVVGKLVPDPLIKNQT